MGQLSLPGIACSAHLAHAQALHDHRINSDQREIHIQEVNKYMCMPIQIGKKVRFDQVTKSASTTYGHPHCGHVQHHSVDQQEANDNLEEE